MKKYSVLYPDPPWKYRNENTGGSMLSGAANKYPCMTTKEIKALPVGHLAAEHSACFMWATAPFLFDAKEVLEAWGFQYRTVAFVWAKLSPKKLEPSFGLGFYTRSCVEYCLLGIRGSIDRQSHSVRQLIETEGEYARFAVREHSEKPQEFRDRIVELCGDVPRLEMFARMSTPGWDVFGNQVKGSISLTEEKQCNFSLKKLAR